MQGLKIESISSIDPELCFLSASYFVGLQCYLVRNNETVANVSRRLNAKKHADYKVELERMMGEKNAIWAKLGAVDHIIPRALKWMVLHPMVVLEEEGAVSLLDHNNDKNHWNAYFKGEEERRKEYV
jgi:hypothetical protein